MPRGHPPWYVCHWPWARSRWSLRPLKLAFFSPLPPAKSGIADYSAALLAELSNGCADVTAFSRKPRTSIHREFDIALYQIGNNSYHDFCYEMALEHPGVVVIHEANLHHLIADMTIKRGDWDAYLREVEFERRTRGAGVRAARARRWKSGPDYEGVPMLRRLLTRSRGRHRAQRLRQSTSCGNAGFTGPIARIPHGAWIPDADRLGYRQQAGPGRDDAARSASSDS